MAITLGDGGWSWFGDPRAVFHLGEFRRTYAGWVSRDGDIAVASFDHGSRKVQRAVLRSGLSVDDHHSPGLLMGVDGHLTVYYNGPGRASMLYRRTTRPEDVSRWDAERRLPTNTPGKLGYTYPNPIHLADERRTYLFWRGAQWWPAFSRRLDGGRWTPARTLLRISGQRPYLKLHSDGVRRIHIAYTEGNANRFVNSIWYLRYERDAFHHADGTRVAGLRGLPLAPAKGDRVYDARASGVRAWVWDVAARHDGSPVIVYALFPAGNDDCIYMYAEWTGQGWRNERIVNGGGRIGGMYAPGISLDHENPDVVYLSREVDGRYVVERWRTADGGATWDHRRIDAGKDGDCLRPITPRGRGGSGDVLWMQGSYGGWTAYQTDVRAHFTR